MIFQLFFLQTSYQQKYQISYYPYPIKNVKSVETNYLKKFNCKSGSKNVGKMQIPIDFLIKDLQILILQQKHKTINNLFSYKNMRKSILWTQKEDQLIMLNFTLIKSKKWKIISNLLKQHGYEKKQTQCRERYINHLAPSLDKNKQISAQQLQLFYQKYDDYGPKWTLIQRFLPKKSQVQLKNIFYGNIRCFIKKIIKYFTNKTAVFVNRMDTFTLQNIYSGKRNFRGLTFIKEDIKKMDYRFDQDLCLSLIQEQKDLYHTLFKALLQQEQTKKSKHYQFFRKIILNRSTIEENQINSQINSDNTNKQNQSDMSKKQLDQPQNQGISEKSSQKLNPMQFPLSQFHIYNWNENQYLYFNQPPIRFPINHEHLTFYKPQNNIYYQNYGSYPFSHINNYYDNFSFSKPF